MPGTSLLLDLAFPAFPDNMGHWMEALLPVYNVLEQGLWKSALPEGSGFIDNIIFVNLRRDNLAVSPPKMPAACHALCFSMSPPFLSSWLINLRRLIAIDLIGIACMGDVTRMFVLLSLCTGLGLGVGDDQAGSCSGSAS